MRRLASVQSPLAPGYRRFKLAEINLMGNAAEAFCFGLKGFLDLALLSGCQCAVTKLVCADFESAYSR